MNDTRKGGWGKNAKVWHGGRLYKMPLCEWLTFWMTPSANTKDTERGQWPCLVDFVVNFQQISRIVALFTLLALNS